MSDRTITQQELDGILEQIRFQHSHAKGATVPKVASALGIPESDVQSAVKKLGSKVQSVKGDSSQRYLVPQD